MTCQRCLLARCLCAEIPTVETRTHVVIVRHHSERFRSSNSGRLAHLALPNSRLVEHGGPTGTAALPPLDGAWLVFPEGEPTTEWPADRPLPTQLIVLDATWSQARKMFRKLGVLRGVPLLRLPEGELPARLRTAPSPDRVSTLEAIARALRLVESEAVAAPLETLFAAAVRRAVELGRIGR
ncbi:MAG: DTW domain-containing protein [Deltaproteobacteria bacterium]|nr:DTW domain-containing protein [Deltaproteobacteria bacterium]